MDSRGDRPVIPPSAGPLAHPTHSTPTLPHVSGPHTAPPGVYRVCMVAGSQDSFAEMLRRHRETAGFSQEHLAERAGISANAVGALERGERTRPYPDTVRRLAEALNLDEDERAALAASVRDGAASAPRRADDRRPPLPSEPTPLFGRDAELDDLRRLLDAPDVRVLTLLGPGGAGKTRLALRLAHDVEPRHPDGVRWVELAPLADPGLVTATIVRALGLEESGADAAEGALRAWARDRRALLVLDNVEHVLDAMTDVLRALDAAPGIRLLATSRAPFGVRGEREFPVPPLAAPPADPRELDRDTSAYPAVELFVWQARRHDPGFHLTADRAAAVGAIARRLDGLPLALELVAARTRLLEPEELLGRVDHLMPLLVGGARDLPERQRTMRAAIAWSEDLLTPRERELFRRLAVFAGGATLEAVAAVAGGDAGADADVLDLLDALAAQSLVTVRRGGDSTRFGMLEPIRQFALARLAEAGEEDDVRRRHARWFRGLAERAAREIEGRAGQTAWADRLESDLDNLRAALDWAQRAPDGADTALALTTSLWRFWEMRWRIDEGLTRLAAALARSDDQPAALRAGALNAAGNLARDAGRYRLAAAYHEECLQLRRELGDARGIAASLNNLGVIARDHGDAERTRALCTESLELYRQAGDRHGSAIALISLGMAAGQLSELDVARTCLQESLDLFRAEGDEWHTAWVSIYLADILVAAEDAETGRMLAAEGVDAHRRTHDAWGVAAGLSVLARADRAGGDLAAAAHQLREALTVAVDGGVERAVPAVLDDLADLVRQGGDRRRAARLAGAAAAWRERARLLFVPRPAGEAARLAALRAGAGLDAWAEGAALSHSETLREAADAADAISAR